MEMPKIREYLERDELDLYELDLECFISNIINEYEDKILSEAEMSYDTGYAEGYDSGYEEGYNEGDN